jgi:hypothetical protein
MNSLPGGRCVRLEDGAVQVQRSCIEENASAVALAGTKAEDVDVWGDERETKWSVVGARYVGFKTIEAGADGVTKQGNSVCICVVRGVRLELGCR